VDMVKRTEAKGLIIILVKYCEAHDYTYPHMRRHLDPAGHPVPHDQDGARDILRGADENQAQAFFEIIRGQ